MKLPKYFKNTSQEITNPLEAEKRQLKFRKLSKQIKVVLIALAAGLLVSSILTLYTLRKVNSFFESNYLKFNNVLQVQVSSPVTVVKKVSIKPKPLVVYQGEVLKEDSQTGLINAPEPKSDRQKMVASVIDWVWGEDANTGRWLAHCESSYGRSLENSQSTASGVFMFIDGTWVAERGRMNADTSLELKLDTVENVRTAYSHFKRNGLGPWEASKECWWVMEQ